MKPKHKFYVWFSIVPKYRFLFVITDFVDTKSNLGEYGNNIKWALDRLGEIVGVNSAKI